MKNKPYLLIPFTLGCLIAPILAQNSHPTLSLSEALTRGLARPDLATTLDGRTAMAESDIVRQQTWDNPQLLVSSERIKQSGVDTNENYLLVSQRIELFGVQRLRTQAAQHHRNAVLFENKSQLLDVKAHIKEQFFEVLYFQKRIQILEGWESTTQKIMDIIALREEAGQVSGYDRRRLLRELSEAQAMIARDRSFHAGSWEQLRTLLNLDKTYTLSGTLLPASPGAGTPVSQHPEFLAYDEEIKAASFQEMAARHWKLPEITVAAGFKNLSVAGDNDNGAFLSARLPLPVFNRNKAGLMQAKARSMVARGEKALAQSRAEGRSRALREQAQQLRASVEKFRKNAVETSQELVSIARLAYQEGEMEMLALLDAYQSLRDARLKAVSLEAEIRGLVIELEWLGGE